jgi:sugar phosphate isomerase/epimerase
MTPKPSSLHRRTFLKTAGIVAAGLGLSRFESVAASATRPANVAPNAERLGWRLACHSFSFKLFTLREAIRKTASLGFRYMGAYPTQPLSPEHPGVLVTAALPAGHRREIKRWLDDAGLSLVHFGVCGFDQGADGFRAAFDFAAELGIESFIAEPPEDAFDALERLCDEYRIDLAIHNHPEFAKNSRYWHPDIVMKHCSGRSKRIGACADTGLWARTGLNPLECLRKLEGRLVAKHFKDMSELGRKGHCVPLGRGVCDVRGMLAEVQRQKARPVFAIEHEFNWSDNLPEIAESAAYFEAVVVGLHGGA